MQIVPVHAQIPPYFHAIEIIFYMFAVGAAGMCLVTVTIAQFSSLFSMRLALRGGENAVEQTVAKVRGEYQLVLLMLVGGIECFLCIVPWLCILKMPPVAAALGCIIDVPLIGLVVWFYKRVRRGEWSGAPQQGRPRAFSRCKLPPGGRVSFVLVPVLRRPVIRGALACLHSALAVTQRRRACLFRSGAWRACLAAHTLAFFLFGPPFLPPLRGTSLSLSLSC